MMRLLEANRGKKQDRDRLNHAAWGAPLAVDQYLERERRLAATAWCRRGFRTWLLVDDSGLTLASCESYEMESHFQPDAGATIETGVAFGIASVFTEPALRGKGYARELLRQVEARFRAERGPTLHAMILYSEVGASIYESLGYVVRPSWERVFPVGAIADQDLALPDLGYLSRAQALSDAPHLPASFGNAGAAGELLIWPSREHLAWCYEREQFYAEIYRRALPTRAGAQLGRARIYWIGDRRAPGLQSLLFEASSVADAEALIQAALVTAEQEGLPEVRIWEEEPFTSWNLLGIANRRVPRQDKLAMILPIDPRIHADHWRIIPRATWI